MKKCGLLLVIILLAGCSSMTESMTLQPTRLVPTQITVTSNIMFNSPTITPTATIALTSISTATPTSTSVAFSKEDMDLTLELLQNNNGCELPCWWGIIPGQTLWSEAEYLLKSFSHITLSESPTWKVYFVRSPILKIFSEVGEVRATFATQGGVVKEIEVSEFDEKAFHLSSFLQKYGIPARILISSYSFDHGLPPNQVPLSVDLYYPDKGINVLYGTYATVQGAQINGCLERSPHLFLWSPSENNRSIDYILGWDNDHTPYLDVQDSSDMDVQKFYEKYSNPQIEPCLQTSVVFWPSQ